MDELMRRIVAAGWGGVAIWAMGEECWNGHLLPVLRGWHGKDVLRTSPGLWDYEATAEAALGRLAELAERLRAESEGHGA